METKFLYWYPIVNDIKSEMISFSSKYKLKNHYLAILLLSDDFASQTYVNLKKTFWLSIWIDVKIFNNNIDIYDINSVLTCISNLNEDENCIWIIVQLPLNKNLINYKSKILSSISPYKDVDWLWWYNFWLNLVWEFDFIPATPFAIIKLLSYYSFDNYVWKNISILWQSNLIWKPLALEFMKQWATVFSFNEFSDLKTIQSVTKKSDIIISATWVPNLINNEFISNKKSQVIVDVWFSRINDKVVWDVSFNDVKDKVIAITPVPWWIWPVTVASLFLNLKKLYLLKNDLK